MQNVKCEYLLNPKIQKNMKTFKIISVALIALVLSLNTFGQSASEVINKNIPIKYFGIDFSKSKGVLLGCSSREMVNKYFQSINELIARETKKYDIGGTFNKTDVDYDLDIVKKSNATLDTNSFQVTSVKSITPLDETSISNIIKSYDLTGKTGVGLVFIAESLDKVGLLATYHMVFFSMPDGKIIINTKVKGKPKGFGMRNFWAYSLYDALKFDVAYKVKSEHTK